MNELKEREFLEVFNEVALYVDQASIDAFEQPWDSLDSIVVLGSPVWMNPTTKNVKLSSKIIPELPIIAWGHSRALASKLIYDIGFNGTFAITGAVQELSADRAISKAEVLKEKIVKLGVNQNNVVAIGKNGQGNTLGNINDAIDYFQQTKPDKRRIGILTNDFHILRSYIMFKSHPFFECLSYQITPIIVEEVLKSKSSKYEYWESQIRELKGYAKLKSNELSGISDFINGSYVPLNK